MKSSGELVWLFDVLSVVNFTPSTTFARYAKPRSFRQFCSAVRPEYSCSPREIAMMESLDDCKLGNLAQFG